MTDMKARYKRLEKNTEQLGHVERVYDEEVRKYQTEQDQIFHPDPMSDEGSRLSISLKAKSKMRYS